MNGILLLLPVFLPLVLGLLSYFLPIRSESCRRLVYSLLILGTTALAWAAILLCDDGAFTLLHFSHRLTIAFRMDGAARLFAGLSATLWPFTMLYGFDYMRHEKHLHMFWAFFTASFGVTLGIAFSANMMTMYLFYELLTLATLPLVMQPMTKAAKKAGIKYLVYSISGAALAFIGLVFLAIHDAVDFTMGVFLSADLYTTFLFFELMSLSSYAWVVQEESPDALDAGKTYLTIAVLGGLVTLMGLFLLYRLTGTLVIADLPGLCAGVTDRSQLWAAALCIFFGFAAKAGVFPLHIWLPKAHPVAPAPASALLSGVLTKAGIFGALIITADILPGEHRWGVLLLALGAVTMVLGAVIAVFSNNLKYILACSSLSQIGFILVGTAALSLLGQHNALAAHGTVLYMMNHSLVKLTLFLLAGVVYCNTHALDLNQIRGFGRGKPLLHILFLCGACSLAGIPGFLGYISKTLVNESLVELAAESGSLGVTAVEWLFLFSGGLTAAYLTKIYAALFWQKPAASTGRTWGTPATTAALILAALPLPVLGLLPHVLAEPVAALALPFVGGHPFGHAVHYLAWENLKGVAISLTIGMAVYFLFIRLVLMDRREGQVVYLERWPRWLSLEDRVYRPAIRGLYRLLNVVLRAVCDALDFLVLLARRTFLRDSRPRRRKSPRSAVLHAMTHGGQRTEQEAADRLGTILDTIRRMEGSLSYALLMACLGLCIVLVCILLYVF